MVMQQLVAFCVDEGMRYSRVARSSVAALAGGASGSSQAPLRVRSLVYADLRAMGVCCCSAP